MKPLFITFVLFLFSLIKSPVQAIHPELFYHLHRNELPKWIADQIQNDLASFQTQLSRKALDQLFAKEGYRFVRVQVVKGNITIQKSKDEQDGTVADEIIPHLYALHSLIPLPEIDFIFSCHDGLPSSLE
ncbi:MAG TPA: hypothetical protein VHA52_03095, partial [Candidatus Babeliaceae bacterium]|nr:hypothetical protein [Candidatus Babeliaceae bacterium]